MYKKIDPLNILLLLNKICIKMATTCDYHLKTENYMEQRRKHWPPLGRHILAQFNDECIVVYQAFCPEIAAYAVQNGKFGGNYSLFVLPTFSLSPSPFSHLSAPYLPLSLFSLPFSSLSLLFSPLALPPATPFDPIGRPRWYSLYMRVMVQEVSFSKSVWDGVMVLCSGKGVNFFFL